MYLITIISMEEWHLDDPQIAMIWALGPLCFEAQTLSVWVVIFFWFSRGFCHFVSPTMSAAHFVCLCCFLDALLLREVFTLTDIHLEKPREGKNRPSQNA